MKKIARVNVKSEIITKGNKIFGAVFIKKNGQERQMNARLNVKKNLAGGENTVERDDRAYLTVFDMNNDGYKVLNLDTLKTVKICGTEYEVV